MHPNFWTTMQWILTIIPCTPIAFKQQTLLAFSIAWSWLWIVPSPLIFHKIVEWFSITRSSGLPPSPSVSMKPWWPRVPVSALSWWSYKKIGDCEQSRSSLRLFEILDLMCLCDEFLFYVMLSLIVLTVFKATCGKSLSTLKRKSCYLDKFSVITNA